MRSFALTVCSVSGKLEVAIGMRERVPLPVGVIIGERTIWEPGEPRGATVFAATDGVMMILV